MHVVYCPGPKTLTDYTWKTQICARSPGRIACTSPHCQRLLCIDGRKRVFVTNRSVLKLNSYILYSLNVQRDVAHDNLISFQTCSEYHCTLRAHNGNQHISTLSVQPCMHPHATHVSPLIVQPRATSHVLTR